MAPLEQVRTRLTATLTAWSVASVAVGAVLHARAADGPAGDRVRGLARQSVAWGAIDLAIAGAGWAGARRPVADRDRETAALRRLLLLNAALDVGYVAAGVALVRAGRLRGRDVVGDGAGVVVQGAFLLGLDVVHAARLRPAPRGTTRL